MDLNSTELGKGPEGLKVVKFKIQATIETPQTAQADAPQAAPGAPAPAPTAQPPAAQSQG